MRRIILFSEIEKNANSQAILQYIFPKDMKNKKMLFMPSGGINLKYQHYYDEWEHYCNQYHASFNLVDNSIFPNNKEKIASEIEKIHQSNILVISGGDVFKLLYYVRRTGMDEEIKNFIKRDNSILAGYSAGAMILTPTIAITTMMVTNQKGKRVPIYEVRGKKIHTGLNGDLTGLYLVDFEIVPHFEEKYERDVAIYKKTARYEVKTCRDDEFFVIEK